MMPRIMLMTYLMKLIGFCHVYQVTLNTSHGVNNGETTLLARLSKLEIDFLMYLSIIVFVSLLRGDF